MTAHEGRPEPGAVSMSELLAASAAARLVSTPPAPEPVREVAGVTEVAEGADPAELAPGAEPLGERIVRGAGPRAA